jgi:hypothetical protein
VPAAGGWEAQRQYRQHHLELEEKRVNPYAAALVLALVARDLQRRQQQRKRGSWTFSQSRGGRGGGGGVGERGSLQKTDVFHTPSMHFYRLKMYLIFSP